MGIIAQWQQCTAHAKSGRKAQFHSNAFRLHLQLSQTHHDENITHRERQYNLGSPTVQICTIFSRKFQHCNMHPARTFTRQMVVPDYARGVACGVFVCARATRREVRVRCDKGAQEDKSRLDSDCAREKARMCSRSVRLWQAEHMLTETADA